MSVTNWLYLVVGLVIWGVVLYAALVVVAEIVAKIGRRWGNGK